MNRLGARSGASPPGGGLQTGIAAAGGETPAADHPYGATQSREHPLLTACGETQAAQFSRWGLERRCIPAEPRRFAALCVAFRSKYTGYSSLTRLVSRAPHRSRRSPEFHHRLLTACGKTHAAQFYRWGLDRRCIPAEPLRFAPPPGELAFCVAFRSKYTRYSSLTRLVSRAPLRSRRSPEFHHRLIGGQRG